MLVLSRYTDETVVVDDRLKITILEVRGNRVKLGFDGPRSMRIERVEQWQERHDFDEQGGEGGGHR